MKTFEVNPKLLRKCEAEANQIVKRAEIKARKLGKRDYCRLIIKQGFKSPRIMELVKEKLSKLGYAVEDKVIYGDTGASWTDLIVSWQLKEDV